MPIFQAGSASVSIVPDFRGAQKAIGEWFAKQGDLTVGVKPDLNNFDLLKAKAELNALSGTASVRVDHKQLSNDLATAMADAFKGATGLFDLGAALSKAIGPALKVGLGGLVTQLAGTLVQAGEGLLALLPAGILALAAPIAAVTVGIHGMSAAFKALSSGNLTQIQQAMDKLAPSARDFVTQIHALGPAWTSLRLDVQQQLFAGLGTEVTNLAHVALPVLKTGLSGIATSLNAGLLLTMKQLIQDGPAFTNIFNNINNAVGQVATRSLPVMVQDFVKMADIGSQFLPQLAQGFDNLVGKFDTWLSHAIQTGQFVQIIQTALAILKQIGALLGNVFGILSEIFKAASASGQQFLGMVVALTGGLKTLLGTAAAQNALKAFFADLNDAVHTILPAFEQLVGVLVVNVLPVVGEFLKALAPIAALLGTQLANALRAISGILPPLAQTLAGLIGAFSPLIPIISQIALTLLPPLLQVAHDLIPVVSALTQAFGAALLQAVQALAPYIKPLGDAFISIVKALLPIIPIIGQLVATLLPPLAKLFIALAPLIVQVVQALLPLLPPLLSLLQTILPPFITIVTFITKVLLKEWIFVLGLLVDAIKFVLTIFTALLNGIIYLVTHAGDIWRTAWGAVRDFFLTVWNAIVNWFEANIIHWFSVTFVNFFTQTIPHFWENAWTTVRDFFVGLWNDVTGWVQTHIIDWFTGTFVNFFTNTIPNAFKTAWNGIRDFFKGLWTDLVSWFDGVLNNFGTFFSNFWAGLKSGVSTIWNDIVHALEVPVQKVINWVWNDTLRPAWNLLNNLWGGTDLQPVVLPGLSAADGAVLPGFTPGRDVHQFFSPTGGLLNLSGGEAIMRPEFTAAVGGDWVASMNAAARAGGISGVQSAMGFANGGVWPSTDFGLSTQLGSRDIGWAQQAALGILSAVVPFLPGGQLVAPLTKYVQAEASGSKNAGGSPIWSVAGGVFRNALNQLWTVAKNAITSTLAPGGGAYANYHAAQAAAAASAANINLGNLGNLSNLTALGRAGNVLAVQQVANGYGWGSGAEWNALVSVISRESGFNNLAQNPTSTAYGIFQFLNSTWAGYGVPKTSDAGLQAVAGLRYIAQRYRDPLGALGHEQQFGWYDQGGYLPPGWSTVYNGTGRHELVLNPQQQTSIGQRLNGGGGFNVGGVSIAMQTANPHEVADELVYRLRVASRGGVYSTVRGG